MDKCFDLHWVDQIDALAISACKTFDRKCVERYVPTRKTFRLRQESQDVPLAIYDDVFLGDVQ